MVFRKKLPFKIYGIKSQYTNKLELTASRFMHFLYQQKQELLEGQLVGQYLLQRLDIGATGVKYAR